MVSITAVKKDIILSIDNKLDNIKLNKKLLVKVVLAFNSKKLLKRLVNILIDATTLF